MVPENSDISTPLILYLLILQVRKEKLGDRITALHQLVSPFGKVTKFEKLSYRSDLQVKKNIGTKH